MKSCRTCKKYTPGFNYKHWIHWSCEYKKEIAADCKNSGFSKWKGKVR